MTHAPVLFLAIDQSTSATKAMLFNTAGRLFDQEALPHQQIYPRAGWVEHGVDDIFQNALSAASSLMRRHPEQAQNLVALSLTNQRETFVVFDSQTGSGLGAGWAADLCLRGHP